MGSAGSMASGRGLSYRAKCCIFILHKVSVSMAL